MRHLLLFLLALPLLSACGADTSTNGGLPPAQPALSVGDCGVGELPEPVLVPGELLVSYPDPSGFGGLGLSGSISTTITGHSAQTAPQLTPRDGINIGIGSDPEPIDVSIEEPESCDEMIVLTADGLPEHGTGAFPNANNPYALVPVPRTYEVPAQPDYPFATHPLLASRLDGVLLNGVPIQMREADCEESWCDTWHVNPLHEPAWYGIDSYNAHVLSDGSYHYHGDPKVLYDDSGATGLTVIGIAADGFPIFGPWVDDDGLIRKVTSSYALKMGDRPTDGSAPAGPYTGEYVEDYEYEADSGDLDICNGTWLLDESGTPVLYGYFVTDTFPYILNCLRGTPQPSFNLALE